jgi:hypothetical protein
MTKGLRNLTYFIFLYTCIEGLVINIMYPNPLAFVVKDVFILMVYVGMFSQQKGGKTSLAKLLAPLGAFCVMVVFFIMLPTPISALGEAVGVKQKLFYIPLIYVGYKFMRDEDDLKTLLKLLSWSAIPVSIFGIYLSFTGPAGLRAIGANYSAIIASTAGESGSGTFWRVPGTFTSPGQFGMYLLVHAVINTAVIFLPNISRGQRYLSILSLVCVMGALLITGSRTPLLATFLCGAFILVAMGKLGGLGVWAFGLYSVMSIAFMFMGASVRDRVGTLASMDHVERLQRTYFGQLFWQSVINYPLGHGIGVATNGARHFTRPGDIILVESYFGIIGIETGFIGIFVFGWLVLAILFHLLSSFRGIRRSPMRSVWYGAFSVVMVMLLLLPVGTPLDSMPTQLYFWFFIGLAARLHDTEQWRLWRLTQVRSTQQAAFDSATRAVWAGAGW